MRAQLVLSHSSPGGSIRVNLSSSSDLRVWARIVLTASLELFLPMLKQWNRPSFSVLESSLSLPVGELRFLHLSL